MHLDEPLSWHPLSYSPPKKNKEHQLKDISITPTLDIYLFFRSRKCARWWILIAQGGGDDVIVTFTVLDTVFGDLNWQFWSDSLVWEYSWFEWSVVATSTEFLVNLPNNQESSFVPVNPRCVKVTAFLLKSTGIRLCMVTDWQPLQQRGSPLTY